MTDAIEKVLGAWDAYMNNMRPETRNDFLREFARQTSSIREFVSNKQPETIHKEVCASQTVHNTVNQTGGGEDMPRILGIPDAVSWLKERKGDFNSPDFDKVVDAAMAYYWLQRASLTAPTPQPASAALEALDALTFVCRTIGWLEVVPSYGGKIDRTKEADKAIACCETIRQVLAQCGVPEGYVLVPKEPTNDMLVAYRQSVQKQHDDFGIVNVAKFYKAMIAAAPVVKGE